MKVSSLIITRFNLPLAFGKKSKQDLGVVPGKTNLDEKWLSDRIHLFNKFCSPSMERQLKDIHGWYVLFDPLTPKETIEAVCHSRGIEPILASSQGQGIMKVVEHFDVGDYLLTLRLDSDDTLAHDFFPSLNESLPALCELAAAAPLALSFPFGCEYDSNLGKFYDRFYVGNPFIGVLEKPNSRTNIFGAFKTAHFQMQQEANFLSIVSDRPKWCINVHGGNVANKIKGTYTDVDYRQLFSID